MDEALEASMHPRHAEMGFPLKVEEIVAIMLFTCSQAVQEDLTMSQLKEVQNQWQKCLGEDRRHSKSQERDSPKS